MSSCLRDGTVPRPGDGALPLFFPKREDGLLLAIPFSIVGNSEGASEGCYFAPTRANHAHPTMFQGPAIRQEAIP